MKKILLLCVAFAATFCALSAQPALRKGFKASQNAPAIQKLSQGIKVNNPTRIDLKKSMHSRAALEEYAWNPKVMSNTNPMYGGLWAASLTGSFQQQGIPIPTTLKYASYFPAELTRRFSGNHVKSVSTYIPDGATKATYWIQDANSGETLWENEVSDWTIEGDDPGVYVTCPCDYNLDGTDIIVGITLKFSRLSSERLVLFTEYDAFGSGSLFDYGEGWTLLGSGLSFVFDLETEGDAGLRNYDASTIEAGWTRAQSNGETSIYASFVNFGAMPVTKAEFKYTLNGEEKTLNLPISTDAGQPDTLLYLGSYVFEITDVAPSAPGRYPVKVSPSKLNGNPDEYALGNSQEGGIVSIGESYPRTAVMEEFTGTWCGWCPRGMVALEKLSEEYGNEFIGIATHYGDAMQTNTYMPFINSVADGFPSCAVNRMTLADPFYGLGSAAWDIKNLIDFINNNPCEASIGVASTLSADQKSLQMNASIEMSIPAEGNSYSVAYVILEDGVTGYKQTNYYSGDASAVEGDPDLMTLVELPQEYNATFDHVARGIYDAFGIAGSLPGNIAVGETMTHHHTVQLPANIADLNNCSVVAMLIDNKTGEIVTAGKAPLGGASTGIAGATADEAAGISVVDGAIAVNAAAGTVSVYTVDGKLIATSAVNGHARLNVEKGTYVVRVENGHSVSVKKVAL